MSSSATSRFPILPLAEMKLGSDHTEAYATDPVPEITDEALMARLREDDKEALALLFLRHARLVRSIGRRIIRDDAEAEDLVQDLFLFLYRKRSAYDSSRSSARSWIVQMSYYLALKRRRYLNCRGFYAAHDGNATEAQEDTRQAVAGYDQSVEGILGRNGWQKIWETLSNDQRETLRLHFFEGYTLSEVSEKIGQPYGNVRNHYYRGLARLRSRLLK